MEPIGEKESGQERSVRGIVELISMQSAQELKRKMV